MFREICRQFLKSIWMLTVLVGITTICSGKYSGGSGDPDNSYQIANVADLLTLAADANDYNKCFIMTADIDLDPNLPGGQVFTNSIIAYDINIANNRFDGNAFTGVFDGNGKTIRNTIIKQPDSNYIGLFGCVRGQILNLGIENVYVIGNSYVGGLVGINGGLLTSCFATGSMNCNTNYVGGLVGSNGGLLTSCFTTGSVTGNSSVGGLVGSNTCAELAISSISACYSTSSVAGNSDVGGLVGMNTGSLSLCYAIGSVTGNTSVGGLTGGNNGLLSCCYSTGSVSGIDKIGGLVGCNYGIPSICFTSSHIIACFWDIQTSDKIVGVGYGVNTGVTGKTTEEMKTLSTFTSEGWDFTDTDGDPPDWMMPQDSYPRLAWEHIVHSIADLNNDGVVDYFDLVILVSQWLFEEIPIDLAPPGGDGIVNFNDFSIFANQWEITNYIDELLDFTEQWLKIGLPICSADISPLPDGDGRVDATDFAVMANDWFEGVE